MSSSMPKMIAMAQYEQTNPAQNFGAVWTDWPNTRTTWVRIWVSWDHIAPHAPNGVAPQDDTAPTWNGGTVKEHVAALDAQIAFARSKGINVMLTFYNFPAWVNNVPQSYPNYRRLPPQDMSQTSWYAQYLLWAMVRWSALNPNNNGAYCNAFEICNEPNLYELWPNDPTPLYYYAGRQMVTAQKLQQQFGIYSPVLAGPALGDDDRLDTGPNLRGCRPFAEALCNYLRSQGFVPSIYWMWTHHNYKDVINGNTTLAQAVRGKLMANSFWAAYPNGDASRPYIYVTEGGSRLADVGGDRNLQATTVSTAYNACHSDASGAGIGMFANYLDVGGGDPKFDTGLRDAPSLAPRPLYATWAGFPTT